MSLKHWINPTMVGLLILFSLPIKLPALQQSMETMLSISFPIRLSLYTLFLPPVAFICIVWNRQRASEIWQQLRLPLIVLLFLFGWMWLGAVMSDYQKIALKHSGRYSIYLITFIAFLFAIERESSKICGQVFTGVYVFLIGLTILDWYGLINIPRLLADYGMHIDLFSRGGTPSSFFENRNPYAVVSAGMFFWGVYNLKRYWFLSSLGIVAALESLLIAGSRNGLLTLALCLLLFLILSIKQIRHTRKIFLLVLGSMVLVGVVFSSIDSKTAIRTNTSFNRLLDVKTYRDLEKLDVRFTLFRTALEVGIANPPILGSGTKTFGHEVFSQSKDLTRFNNTWYKNAFNSHNAPLTIWIEMGWVGLIAATLFLYLWFRPALRASPVVVMPMIALCVGQIVDYFVWEILFMAFQSFFFASFASAVLFERKYTT